LSEAIIKIKENNNCFILAVSSVYKTKPYGVTEQDVFFNAAIKISTELHFKDLLSLLKKIEIQLGRKKTEKWHEREIDLDILFYNDIIFEDDQISIPHKEIEYRDFVLVPLCELEPELIHPLLNKKICDIHIEDSKKCIIEKLSEKIF